jgi:hypothetical protein
MLRWKQIVKPRDANRGDGMIGRKALLTCWLEASEEGL